jgi:predicted sulfurtransferase
MPNKIVYKEEKRCRTCGNKFTNITFTNQKYRNIKDCGKCRSERARKNAFGRCPQNPRKTIVIE